MAENQKTVTDTIEITLTKCPACTEPIVARADVAASISIRERRSSDDAPARGQSDHFWVGANTRLERITMSHQCATSATERIMADQGTSGGFSFEDIMDAFFGGVGHTDPEKVDADGEEYLARALAHKRAHSECWWCDQQAVGVARTDRLPDEVPSCGARGHGLPETFRYYDAERADPRKPTLCDWCDLPATGTVDGKIPSDDRRPMCSATAHGAFLSFRPFDDGSTA